MTFPPFPFLICMQAQEVNGSAVTQRGMKNKVYLFTALDPRIFGKPCGNGYD
jgi:hypothetical protein